MRVRRLDAAGDMMFGRGQSDFLVDSPALVQQMVKTRLLLATGEWFLDTTVGTPYSTDVLGTGTSGRYDAAIKERILLAPGAKSLVSYSSSRGADRKLRVNAAIDTVFGSAAVSAVLP